MWSLWVFLTQDEIAEFLEEGDELIFHPAFPNLVKCAFDIHSKVFAGTLEDVAKRYNYLTKLYPTDHYFIQKKS